VRVTCATWHELALTGRDLAYLIDASTMCECTSDAASLVTDAASGDVVCTSCGVVVEAHIFDERLEFTSEDAGARASLTEDWLLPPGPTVLVQSSGHLISNKDPHATTRAFFKVLDSMSHGFSTDVLDTAKVLCRDYTKDRVVKKDSRPEHAAAALYLATKMRGGGAGRSRREMAVWFSMGEDRLTALTKSFVKTLGPTCRQVLEVSLDMDDLLHRAVDRMADLDEAARRSLKKTAHEVALCIRAEELEGKTPRGVCGGVLACAVARMGLELTKKQVASACLVSATTIDKMLKVVTGMCN